MINCFFDEKAAFVIILKPAAITPQQPLPLETAVVHSLSVWAAREKADEETKDERTAEIPVIRTAAQYINFDETLHKINMGRMHISNPSIIKPIIKDIFRFFGLIKHKIRAIKEHGKLYARFKIVPMSVRLVISLKISTAFMTIL